MGLATICAVTVTAAWYLLAHAEILRFLQVRYPSWLDRLLGCAACAGFWLGCIAALVAGVGFNQSYLGMEPAPTYFAGVWLCGLISLVTTPFLGWVLIGSLKAIENLTTEEDK